MFERLAHALTMADRERAGREAIPSGAIMDAQAARLGGIGVEGERGYDPARRVVGRKRHALTDTGGRLLIGYASRSHFSRAFRATYGLDPRRYREVGGQEEREPERVEDAPPPGQLAP